MSPTPESPAGFGAGRLPWGSIDLTERVPTPTTEYVDTDDDDDVTPRSPGGGPLTLRRARELQADKERAHAAAAAALGAGPPLPSSSRGDDTARVHVPNTTSAGRPVSREASSGFHPDSFAGSRPQSREWSGGGGGGGPGRRVTAAEISGAMRGVRAPKGSAAWESSPSPPTDLVRQQPRVVVGKNDEVHHEPAVDSSEEFERETDALLSRGAALMEEPAGGAEKGADTAVHESKPTSPASPERRATPPPAITSDTSPSAASSEDENREPGVDDETGPPVKPIPSPGIPGIPTEIPTVTELDAQGESLEVPRRASMPPPRRGWIDETEDGADDLELAAAVHSVPPPSVAPLPSAASPAKTSPAPRPRGGTTGVRGVVAIGLCVQAPGAATRSPEQERREANDADQPALKDSKHLIIQNKTAARRPLYPRTRSPPTPPRTRRRSQTPRGPCRRARGFDRPRRLGTRRTRRRKIRRKIQSNRIPRKRAWLRRGRLRR